MMLARDIKRFHTRRREKSGNPCSPRNIISIVFSDLLPNKREEAPGIRKQDTGQSGRQNAMGTALLTDLYELTMAQSYLEHGKTGNAVFSLFCRTLPGERNFLVACGLETLIRKISEFRFTGEDIAYLDSLGIFSSDFLGYLRAYRFRGNLFAVPEGTVVFQNEPLVQIEGSLPDIQILETMALNCIHFETLAASKAARITTVSRGKSVVDFGFRRAHMPEAGIAAARAAYIAGFSATSNLEAGRLYGIPVVGTMAHSYVMLFASEEAAFRAYHDSFPDRDLFLIDTYNAISCTDTIIRLAKEGIPVTGVRIDSGDIPEQVTAIRKRLDAAGLPGIRIFVSNGVDEYSIDAWLAAGIPIDSFGVGTHFITSSDAPFLDMIYKLVEYEGEPRFKSSPGKATFPYRRQIQRHYAGSIMDHDEVVVAHDDEGEGLVRVYLRNGEPVRRLPTLDAIRITYETGNAQIPDRMKSLEKEEYPVIVHQKYDPAPGPDGS
jgi:nicotinate phosphoribosyltransferase